ncbi:hypothetical protein Barb7_02691 [Bacteroidales bacterium Barb7]|nr:hypothetical protein Barb7_02691 [Bacteroidales bacterium Barb7]
MPYNTSGVRRPSGTFASVRPIRGACSSVFGDSWVQAPVNTAAAITIAIDLFIAFIVYSVINLFPLLWKGRKCMTFSIYSAFSFRATPGSTH